MRGLGKVKIVVAAAAAVGLMMFVAAGSASAACTTDSSSGRDSTTKDTAPLPGSGIIGSVWVDASGVPGSGDASAEGAPGYIEWSGSQNLTSGGSSASQSVEANGPATGYIDLNGSVNGTTVSGSEDAATSDGSVSGSGDLTGTTFNDLEVNPVPGCLTP